jgi:NADPH:quinone reductase-like Zn-dependent oxidoreductase
MAGEVVAVGEKVTDWKVGDRVCPNFFPDLVYGNRATPKAVPGGLGAVVDGTMTQYKVFRSHVCFRHILNLLPLG